MSHRGSFPFTSNRLSAGDGAHWQADAVCRDEDPEKFFPIGTAGPALLQVEQAKAVCRRCPVTDQCLQWALDIRDRHGVFAGTTPQERAAILARRDGVMAVA